MTKTDKLRQLASEAAKSLLTGCLSEPPIHDPNTYRVPLSTKQKRAISLLLAGSSITDAAKVLGVGRQTISSWVNRHYSFKVAMEAERQALWQRSRDELMGLAGNALVVIRKHLDEGSLTAAISVIKAVGLGDRQLVLEADTARTQEFEQDRTRIEHQIFRRNLAAFCARQTDASNRSETDEEAAS